MFDRDDDPLFRALGPPEVRPVKIGETDGGLCVVDFGRPICAFMMPPAEARNLAIGILESAARIDGKPVWRGLVPTG